MPPVTNMHQRAVYSLVSEMYLAISLCLIARTLALTCYDCYSTGAESKECSTERTCTGVACMIFDAGDNKTSTAFCLLAIRGEDAAEEKNGCWLEPDGKGKHCMCHSDFCNKLPEKSERTEDPLAPLLPNAQFLKQNPLVDYENPKMDEESKEEGSRPLPKLPLFPGIDEADPHVAGDDSEDDLVPVDFEEYDRDNKKESDAAKPRQSETPSQASSLVHPPPSVLFWLTMAASWARVFVLF